MKMTSSQNTARSTDVSLRTAALVAGLGLLVMAILAAFANFYVLPNLVVPGDAKGTADNIMASGGLFRIGICSFLVAAVLDVVVAWALYVLLKPVNRSLSLLAAWFRVVYAAIFAMAISNLISALLLLNGSAYLNAIETDQLQAQAMFFLSAFDYGWEIGYAFFGLHLVILSYLVFRSGYMPRWLGLLLTLAGLGYLVDTFGKLLLPNYTLTIAQFTFVGELLLLIWLLWKGIRGFDRELPKRS
jgi:hypothetical protein